MSHCILSFQADQECRVALPPEAGSQPDLQCYERISPLVRGTHTPDHNCIGVRYTDATGNYDWVRSCPQAARMSSPLLRLKVTVGQRG
jgi:hypothetical protein